MSQRTRTSSASQSVEINPNPSIAVTSISSSVPVSAVSVSSVESVISSTSTSVQVSPDKSSAIQRHNIAKAGWLEKLGKYTATGTRARVASVLTKRWKQRFFIMSDRTLYYFSRVPTGFGSPSKYPEPSVNLLADTAILEEDGSSPLKPVDTPSKKPAFSSSAKASIDLTKYHSVVQDLDSFPGKFCFRIMSLGSEQTLCLACANNEFLKQWIDAVRPCLSDEKEAQKNNIAWVEKQQSDVESLASNSTRRGRMSPLKFFSRMRKSDSAGKTSLSSAASTINDGESSEESLEYSTAGHSRSVSDAGAVVPVRPPPIPEKSAKSDSISSNANSSVKQRQNTGKRSSSSSPAKTVANPAISRGRNKKWSVALFLISVAVVIVAVYKFSAELAF